MNSALRMRTKVVSPSFMPVPTGLLQRKCACGGTPGPTGECEACRKKKMQRRLSPSVISPQPSALSEAPPIVHEVLRAPGHPLEASTRSFMEPRFGHDFSAVRVHADSKAAESARGVNALAYTVGNNIVLGEGRYAPDTTAGSRLLAHELTHVIQQEGAGPYRTLAKLTVDQPGDPLEREADFMAAAVTRLPNPPTKGRPGGSLPYREAIELARCIEIMGKESAEYCREVVLGERREIVPCDLTTVQNPLSDFSTFQSPGASGWRGAKFGCYRSSCTKKHKGWDIHASPGTPVTAAVTGSVTHHQDPGGFGDYIKLKSQTDPTRVYLYAHLSAREPTGHYCVGKTIGQSGTSGNASADRPHLHFEVHLSGSAVDPAGYFTEPGQVVEASGSAASAIDKTLAAPCNPCAM
jgi:murein DD-endopeptidase MepM/ murein hydrolase activator NlpD